MSKENFKNKAKNISLATVLSAGALVSTQSNAFQIENDGWTFSVHGNVNASYIHANCDSGGAVVLGAFLCSGSQDPSAISNGYLPTSFEFALATNRGGYDISVHSAFDRGLDTNEAFNAGGDGEGFRTWMTVSNEEIGSIKLGRDYGIFAYDSTFNDMSVFGVGGGFLVSNPVNTQLGTAGTGYIFFDRITQATWTLPTSENLTAQIGIFQPLNLSSFSFTSGAFAGAETGSESPGFHGRVRLDLSNGFISSTFITQDVEVAGTAADYRASGLDVTGQLNFGGLSLTGTYYTGDGLGHTGLLIDAVDPAGTERDSDGYYVQAVYTAGSTKYGINYGVNNLDPTTADVGTVIEEKRKLTGGIYHSLASGITIAAEYSKLDAENKAGGDIENDIFNIGAIFFF